MDFTKYGKSHASKCEDCEFYDYDELTGTYSCRQNLDEDEMTHFLTSNTRTCHFYRYYDEYKSTHRQL